MNKTKIVNIIVVLMFLLLGLALFNTEVIQGRKYRDLSNKNCIRLIPQMGSRGKILDRNGQVLVDNKISYDVLIAPEDPFQQEKILQAVRSVLKLSLEDLEKAYRGNFISVSVPTLVARNIGLKNAIALEEIKVDQPGIIIMPRPVRNYPFGNLAAHVMGYLGEIDRWRLTKLSDYGYKTKDKVGFGGVEEKYDYYLRQEEGGVSLEVDHRGRLTRVLGYLPPKNGLDIQLTLDLKIEKISEAALSGLKGCVVIMDPYTGEIISMASFPVFYPGDFIESGKSLSAYFTDPDAPLVNRAISSSFPPASVFKVVVATAALETKKINTSTTFVCSGSTLIGKRKFNCWSIHGPVNLNQAIIHSCDVFFYRTGLLVGAQVIHDYALKFGLGKPSGFELPYEAGGFVPSPLWRKINKFKNWFDGDTANLAIGQGDCLITPLQMARMICVFANKGYLVTPYIVKAIGGRDISRYQKRITPLSLKASTINNIREGLRGVVSSADGTASTLSVLPVEIAGKTGTAQASPKQPHGWFVGFFPYKEPRYVICVFLEHGGSGYAASVVAEDIIKGMHKEGLL
ncbi:MAG: penicillin-binding protein 2 [Candidatus Omnitrophota bacterium]